MIGTRKTDPQFCTIADSEFLEISCLQHCERAEKQHKKPFAANSFSSKGSQETGTAV